MGSTDFFPGREKFSTGGRGANYLLFILFDKQILKKNNFSKKTTYYFAGQGGGGGGDFPPLRASFYFYIP